MPKLQRSNSTVSSQVSVESRRRRPSKCGPPSPTDPTCPYPRSQSIATTIAQRWQSEPDSVRQAYAKAEHDVLEEFEVEEMLMRSAKARKRARARRAKWIATHEPIALVEMEMQELGMLVSEPESTDSQRGSGRGSVEGVPICEDANCVEHTERCGVPERHLREGAETEERGDPPKRGD